MEGRSILLRDRGQPPVRRTLGGVPTGRDIIREALRWPPPDADVCETEERILHAGEFNPEVFREALAEVDGELLGMPGHGLLLALRALISDAARSGIAGWDEPKRP